jgi:hypothetical protein
VRLCAAARVGSGGESGRRCDAVPRPELDLGGGGSQWCDAVPRPELDLGGGGGRRCDWLVNVDDDERR